MEKMPKILFTHANPVDILAEIENQFMINTLLQKPI